MTREPSEDSVSATATNAALGAWLARIKVNDQFEVDGGRAIVWGVAPLDWNIDPRAMPPDAARLASYHVAAWVNGTEVLSKQITYEEAMELDSVIGFSFVDALGCKYGFGVLFAARKETAS